MKKPTDEICRMCSAICVVFEDESFLCPECYRWAVTGTVSVADDDNDIAQEGDGGRQVADVPSGGCCDGGDDDDDDDDDE